MAPSAVNSTKQADNGPSGSKSDSAPANEIHEKENSASATSKDAPDLQIMEAHSKETMQQKLARLQSEWRNSTEGKSMTKAFKNKIFKRKIQITEFVVVGLGPLYPGPYSTGDAVAQLAVLICWVDLFRAYCNISNVYIQDPEFMSIDVDLLRSCGFEILFDNTAHVHVKNTTFLFSPGCPWHELLPLLSHSSPAILVTPDFFDFDLDDPDIEDITKNKRLMYFLQSPVIRAFFEKRASKELLVPRPEPHQQAEYWHFALVGMKFYWKAKMSEAIDENVEDFYDNFAKVELGDLDVSGCECLYDSEEEDYDLDSDDYDDLFGYCEDDDDELPDLIEMGKDKTEDGHKREGAVENKEEGDKVK